MLRKANILFLLGILAAQPVQAESKNKCVDSFAKITKKNKRNEPAAKLKIESETRNMHIQISELAYSKADSVPIQKTNHQEAELHRLTLKVSKVGKKPEIAWARIDNKGEEWKPIDSLNSYKHFTSNPDSLFEYANIVFPTAKLNPKMNYVLHFQTPQTEQLSKQLGKKIWLEHSFDSPSQKIDWTALYLKDFKAVSESGEIIPNVRIEPDSPLTHVGISVLAKKNEINIPEQVPIDMAISLNLDIALPDSVNLEDFLKIRLGLHGRLAGGRLAPLMRRNNISPTEVQNTINRFFTSMKNKENQKFAIDCVRRGSTCIEENMAPFSAKPFLDTQNIGGSVMKDAVLSEKVSMFGIMNMVSAGRIPREAGAFASLHGEWAHHAQIIAGLKGLNEKEKNIFECYLTDDLALTVENWPGWNLLFDSRADGVHGNRFWRDALNAEK
jgi:hypothetical protein